MNNGPNRAFYIGTYSGGIYRCRFGEPAVLVAETTTPAFLAMHPRQPFLYSVGECTEGSVSAWEISPDAGGLSSAGTAGPAGAFPCPVDLDSTGQLLVLSNYGDGT